MKFKMLELYVLYLLKLISYCYFEGYYYLEWKEIWKKNIKYKFNFLNINYTLK